MIENRKIYNKEKEILDEDKLNKKRAEQARRSYFNNKLRYDNN
jgi:hypothetical protein